MTDAERPTWVLEEVEGGRFPYRISIRRGDEVVIALRVRERWPGAKGNVFCLDEAGRDLPPASEVLERVPVLSLDRYGRRLAVVLDRPQRKRCDFLFLEKAYKEKEGTYEQIFWRTERGLKRSRTRGRVGRPGSVDLHVVVDAREHYPWRFPDCTVEEQRLPAGDYGLLHEGELIACVERKTLENLLHAFDNMPALHQQLGEVASYPHPALVVEAPYDHLLQKKRIRPYTPEATAGMIGEVQACHPGLPVIFAGNRKLGRAWTLRFFRAVVAQATDAAPPVQRVLDFVGETPLTRGGWRYRVRRAILEDLPDPFRIADLRERFPDLTDARFRQVLRDLRDEGRIELRGHGRGARYVRLESGEEG